ncbi:MAG: hypothetical protein ACR2O6_08620 [Ilumatobacteraceae bacterium]
MAQLVLLVVAAAWAAVLIPPMLRSRVENRPNSSVTDFRRQLNKLQSTATPARGSVRALGRPLAQSPLQRPAAGGRPGHKEHHRQSSLRGGTVTAPRPRSTGRSGGGMRTHGDPTGGQERPAQDRKGQDRKGQDGGGQGRNGQERNGQDRHHRQSHVTRDRSAPRQPDQRTATRRRRTNVLFVLVITTACTLFLAATTSSSVMLYGFALAFLALCGYVYLLTQLRQRETAEWSDGWLDDR